MYRPDTQPRITVNGVHLIETALGYSEGERPAHLSFGLGCRACVVSILGTGPVAAIVVFCGSHLLSAPHAAGCQEERFSV